MKPLTQSCPLIGLCLVGLIFASLWLIQAPTAKGQAETIVQCRLERQEITVGEQTTLYLEVQNVTDLYGYQLDLYFDNDVVQLSGVIQDDIEGMFLGNFLSADFVVSNEIDNDFGAVFLALTQVNPSPPRSGSGELAHTTVRGIDTGTAEFSFESVILADAEGNEIESSHRNCVLTMHETGQATSTIAVTTTPSTPTLTTTRSPTPTDTAPVTGTPTTPSATPSPTITLTPTFTPSATNTPLPPTSTTTQTPVPLLTALGSVIPTIVAGYTPTPSSTAQPTQTLASTPSFFLTPTPNPAQQQERLLQTGLRIAIGGVLLAGLALLFGLVWQLRRGR